MKICLGLPTNRGIKPRTAEALMKMVAYSEHEIIPLISTRGYNTAENRNRIAAQAVKNECTHLFLTDDDMILEPDTIDRLLMHDKGIVGATYYTKYEQQELVIEYLKETKGDLFKCKALGGGALLIKIDVLKKVQQPHFGYKWNYNGMVTVSNDWFFCEKAREAGYDIWVDTTLSPKHIGSYKF